MLSIHNYTKLKKSLKALSDKFLLSDKKTNKIFNSLKSIVKPEDFKPIEIDTSDLNNLVLQINSIEINSIEINNLTSEDLDNLKSDLNNLHNTLKSDLNNLHSTLKSDLNNLHSTLKSDLNLFTNKMNLNQKAIIDYITSLEEQRELDSQKFNDLIKKLIYI